jgi:hypothetical protein
MVGLEVEGVNPPRTEPEEVEPMKTDEELYDASELLNNVKTLRVELATAEEL